MKTFKFIFAYLLLIHINCRHAAKVVRTTRDSRKNLVITSPYATLTGLPSPNTGTASNTFGFPVQPGFTTTGTQYVYPAVTSQNAPLVTGITPYTAPSSMITPITTSTLQNTNAIPTSYPTFVKNGQTLQNVPIATYQTLQSKSSQMTISPPTQVGNPLLDGLMARANNLVGGIGNNSNNLLGGISGGIQGLFNVKTALTDSYNQSTASAFANAITSVDQTSQIDQNFQTQSANILNQGQLSGVNPTSTMNTSIKSSSSGTASYRIKV